MIDKVIVTVAYRNRQFDMEFPANVPLRKIKPALSLALQTKGFVMDRTFDLIWNGQLLKSTDTLLQSGVWDGCCLELQDRSSGI